jgi:hypothetical protein
MNLNEECLLKYLNNPQSLDSTMNNLKSYIHLTLNNSQKNKHTGDLQTSLRGKKQSKNQQSNSLDWGHSPFESFQS